MRAPTAMERSQDDMVSGGDESSYKYFDEQITRPTRTGPHLPLAMRTAGLWHGMSKIKLFRLDQILSLRRKVVSLSLLFGGGWRIS